jgi:hypothetical protein
MLNDGLYEFISKRKGLIWYVRDLRALDETSVVEHTLNYGNWEDFKELVRIMGIDEVARIFRKQMVTGRQRGNYHIKTRHYFEKYFERYAPVNHA